MYLPRSLRLFYETANFDAATAVLGGASVIGGLAQASGAKSAAKAQTAAANQASETQLKMFNQIQQNLQPYMQGGNASMNALLSLMGLMPVNQAQQALANQPATAGATAQGNAAAGSPGHQPVYDPRFNSPEQWMNQYGVMPGQPIPGQPGYQQAAAAFAGGTPPTTGGTQNNQIFANLTPDMLSGIGTSPLLAPPTPPTAPHAMDQATLEATPGYQFNLSQGLRAAQNAASARGLSSSGAGIKGAEQFATGLADSTYQNQFANQQSLFGNEQTRYSDTVANQTNIFNRLLSLATQGESAAANVGTQGTQTAANIGNNIIGAGAAQAGGYMSAANAIGNAAGGIGQGYLANRILGMYGQNNGAVGSPNTGGWIQGQGVWGP